MRWSPRLPLAAVALTIATLSAACIPLPPGAFTPEQFAAGQGPNILRAEVFQGYGAWWDVWDWSPTFTGNRAAVGLADLDRLAASGVQTLYVQTASYRRPEDLLDPALLRQIIDGAHARGIRIVGWYLPEHVDMALDMRRMNSAIALGFDGFGIDIESSANPDVAARSQVLISEVSALRAQHPDLPLAAIPVAPVVWEELNHDWWPNFPYRTLALYFDAWMPQNYFTNRTGALRDPYLYNVHNIQLLRQLTGVGWLPVHPIGGTAAQVTNDDIAAMYRAMVDTSSIGGSLYDDNSTSPALVERLRWYRIPK